MVYRLAIRVRGYYGHRRTSLREGLHSSYRSQLVLTAWS